MEVRQDIVSDDIKKQAEELALDSQFRAQSMPTFTTPQVVKPERKVEPQPFQSQCETRGEEYQKELRVNVGAQDELAQDDIDAIFMATGNRSICSNPFM